MGARCRNRRIVIGKAERLNGERVRAELRTPSATSVSERGWGADATRAGEHVREPHELTMSGELLQPRCALVGRFSLRSGAASGPHTRTKAGARFGPMEEAFRRIEYRPGHR